MEDRDLKRTTRKILISNLLLFVISVVMVLGFFYHGEFYQIGLMPLLIIGGGVVFGVLKLISWANSEFHSRGKGRVGSLTFRADRIPSILYGEVRRTIRPMKRSRLRVGMLCHVRATVSGRSVGMVLITDIRRKRLGDLTERDTEPEGKAVNEFRDSWKKRYGANDDQLVRIIQFEAI